MPTISTGAARRILYLMRGLVATGNAALARDAAELERAMAKRLTRKPIRAKRKTKAKRAETSDVYEAVADRARDACECGCGSPLQWLSCGFGAPVLDHFFGRAKADERIETCWMLRNDCNRAKTDNNPGAAEWLEKFIGHCECHGYSVEAVRARNRLAFVNQRNAFQRKP